jgi:TPP-dependent indolepyruvate ferredoxin oxidoreductase alpha subunit
VDGRDVTSPKLLFAIPTGVTKRDLTQRGQSHAKKSPLLAKRAYNNYACQEDEDCINEYNCDFCALMFTPRSLDRCASNG